VKVLVVDDDAFDRAYLETVFRHLGDDVVCAGDGASALAVLERDVPDVVISDVLMPGMDGYRLCRALREDERFADIPFVFYTATYTDPQDEALADDLGADAFGVKPCDPEQIAALVAEGIAHRRSEQAPAGIAAGADQEYNEVIVLKLEKTVAKLEAANRELARYSLLFENAFDPMVFLTRDLHVLEANPAAARLLGYPREVLAGMPIHQVHGPQADPRSDSLLSEAESHPVCYITQWRSNDGTLWPVEVRASGVTLGGEKVLVVLARDLTEQFRQEDELKGMIRQLEMLAYSAVDAFGKVVESRDPYTAGHQERVADLAAAIAAKLGMSGERCKAVRMAGFVHDVGKTAVPSEILNKPGALSPLEFELIKTHAQTSYDILSQIEFPWPIAQMVLQHHERMDGSGYPQGLKGDRIVLEARILAVADVVEAMTFHRPYKAVLGLDQAIQEIIDGAGTLYDADVARACVELFTADGYAFPSITRAATVSQAADTGPLPVLRPAADAAPAGSKVSHISERQPRRSAM
jgi:PAS domain S-box-containing protein/putative nucleotidyltransferase with HDIG domain